MRNIQVNTQFAWKPKTGQEKMNLIERIYEFTINEGLTVKTLTHEYLIWNNKKISKLKNINPPINWSDSENLEAAIAYLFFNSLAYVPRKSHSPEP